MRGLVVRRESSLFKNYGVGVGVRSDYHDLIISNRPRTISWGEVITENFMPWFETSNFKPYQTLEKLRESLPLAFHGVSMNIGSTDDLNFNYLQKLKEMKESFQPIWISDHLCWTGVNNKNMHDLFPVPYTEEALNHVVNRILKVQDILGERIVIENVSSYIQYTSSSMSEWEFLTEVLSRSDCGLLLDINNVYVSSVNHEFNPYTYLNSLPLERVAQIHVAGHYNDNGFLVDTHAENVCEDVWSLFRWFHRNKISPSTMLERDDNLPDWNELEKEILMIHQIKSEEIRVEFKKSADKHPTVDL